VARGVNYSIALVRGPNVLYSDEFA
jgi:hypothetical protein